MSVTVILLLLGGGIGFVVGWSVRGIAVRFERAGRGWRRKL